MSYLKVQGHRTLVRETSSNAIVNTDRSAYQVYMQRVKEAKQSNNDLRYAVREINNLSNFFCCCQTFFFTCHDIWYYKAPGDTRTKKKKKDV